MEGDPLGGTTGSGDGVRLSEETAFNALRIFLQAYWERGLRSSDDLAALLGSLDVDPAQRDDWSNAVERALSGG